MNAFELKLLILNGCETTNPQSVPVKISNGALKSDKLPSRLKIFDWGVNFSTQGTFRAADKTRTLLSTNQHTMGFDRVAIDYNHCTVSGSDAYKDFIKNGQPPAVFGYGTVTPVAGDGIFLEDIIWTPLGVQCARNFEDISPAVKDDSGEVTFVHSVALTPNGSIFGLQFFSSTDVKKRKSLAEIFDAEGVHIGPLHT
jgi:hypothetical protein